MKSFCSTLLFSCLLLPGMSQQIKTPDQAQPDLQSLIPVNAGDSFYIKYKPAFKRNEFLKNSIRAVGAGMTSYALIHNIQPSSSETGSSPSSHIRSYGLAVAGVGLATSADKLAHLGKKSPAYVRYTLYDKKLSVTTIQTIELRKGSSNTLSGRVPSDGYLSMQVIGPEQAYVSIADGQEDSTISLPVFSPAGADLNSTAALRPTDGDRLPSIKTRPLLAVHQSKVKAPSTAHSAANAEKIPAVAVIPAKIPTPQSDAPVGRSSRTPLKKTQENESRHIDLYKEDEPEDNSGEEDDADDQPISLRKKPSEAIDALMQPDLHGYDPDDDDDDDGDDDDDDDDDDSPSDDIGAGGGDDDDDDDDSDGDDDDDDDGESTAGLLLDYIKTYGIENIPDESDFTFALDGSFTGSMSDGSTVVYDESGGTLSMTNSSGDEVTMNSDGSYTYVPDGGTPITYVVNEIGGTDDFIDVPPGDVPTNSKEVNPLSFQNMLAVDPDLGQQINIPSNATSSSTWINYNPDLGTLSIDYSYTLPGSDDLNVNSFSVGTFYSYDQALLNINEVDDNSPFLPSGSSITLNTGTVQNYQNANGDVYAIFTDGYGNPTYFPGITVSFNSQIDSGWTTFQYNPNDDTPTGQINVPSDFDLTDLEHEYGHYLQGEYFGYDAWLVVAAGSVANMAFNPGSHDDYWSETSANALSALFFGPDSAIATDAQGNFPTK
jgi:hypothetical protein